MARVPSELGPEAGNAAESHGAARAAAAPPLEEVVGAPPAVEVFGRFTGRDGRKILAAGAVVFAVWGLAVVLLHYQGAIVGFVRGQHDLRGRWRYQPRHPVDRTVIDSIDQRGVHEELLPRWVTAAAHLRDDPEAEALAYEQLAAAVAEDRNLGDILEEERAIITDDEVLGRAERLSYLTWAWNQYLDRAGQPYLVDGTVGVGWGRQAFYYVVTYRALADLSLRVGDRPARVRLVARADPVNVRELHVGGTSGAEDGATVVLDRLQEFALDAVWPLLGGAELHPGGTFEAAYAEAVTDEVGAGIGEERLAILARSSGLRGWLLDVARSVAEREPCSGLAILSTPFDGHPDAVLDVLVDYAYLSLDAACPAVKVEEMVLLHKASHALRDEPGLGEALEALLAWLARTVAVHEARHVGDLDEDGAIAVRCDGCGPEDVAAETSAYLASFAWGEGPVTAYYQACRAVQSGRNPHAAAMEVVDGWLDRECLDGPPEELAPRARELEAEHLGRSEPVLLPAAFPDRLPVSRWAGRRRYVVGREGEWAHRNARRPLVYD